MESLSPQKMTLSERFFLLKGLRRYIQFHLKATSSLLQILHENIFAFDLAGGKPDQTNFS